ncbi:MAG: hypothetical protein U0401_13240 [Anaerolineae bacterium]
MGLLDSLKSFLGGGPPPRDEGYWIYVRCRRCGEVIKTRLDLSHNLTENDEGGYTASKTLVGSKLCFERIEVTLTFDEQRRLLGRDITRGDFITAEEFAAVQPDP